MDKRIEATFVALLNNKTPPPPPGRENEEPVASETPKQPKSKLELRPLVLCDQVEEHIFGTRSDPEKVYGRKKNRANRVIAPAPEKSLNEETNDEATTTETRNSIGSLERLQISSDAAQAETYEEDHFTDEHEHTDGDDNMVHLADRPEQSQQPHYNQVPGQETLKDYSPMYITSGTRIRPSQTDSLVNGSVGGEKGWAEHVEETPEMLAKRLEGQKRVDEREMIRNVARRGCIFGFMVDDADMSASKVKYEEREPRKSKGKDKKQGKHEGDGVKKNVEDEDNGDRKNRRMCEAVMQGDVVEPSYAKGAWSIRWRE